MEKPKTKFITAAAVAFSFEAETVSAKAKYTTYKNTAPSARIRKTSNNLAHEVRDTVALIKANIFGLRDIKLKVKNTKVAQMKAKQINHINSFIYDHDMELTAVMFVKDGHVWSMGGPANDPGLKHFISSFTFIPKSKK